MVYRQRRAGGFFFWIFILILVGAGAWSFGFLRFIDDIPTTVADPARRTEAIVVLTGGSERLTTGLSLLAAKQANRLFVSGVYKGVDVAQLLALNKRAPEKLACCIEIGHAAASTRENARETAEWLALKPARSIRLVTANYHMPRSLIEFQAQMPALDIEPHPVFPKNVYLDQWWRWPGTFELLAGEFNKYLIARTRGLVAEIWAYGATDESVIGQRP